MFFKTETICFDQKWFPLLLQLGLSSCFCWALRNPPATQQTSNSYFAYNLLLKKFHRARLKEFEKSWKICDFLSVFYQLRIHSSFC